MKQPTRTTNRLHFSDLDPLRFEDLCLNIVSRTDTFREINHFGRKGADLGVDIFAIQNLEGKEKIWFIQCKRFIRIGKADITDIVDKVAMNVALPDKLLVIVACDVSRNLHQYLKDYSSEKGISEVEIWTASVLEAKLYKDYKDLLFVYFGVRVEKKTQDNATRIKYSLRMKKRVEKELIDHEYLKKNRTPDLLSFKPYAKFITHKVFIRSVDDTSYPDSDETPDGKISPWFRTFFYDTYHNGIEFWLNVAMSTPIIMDEHGFWEPLSHDDKRRNSPKYKTFYAIQIGRIPYHHIVEILRDGDEYFSEPHLFCKFDIQEMPYEEIYYKTEGDPERKIPDWDLDKTLRTEFPDE
ncbi:restriction endonuclease [Dyadobacter frigoris]|uniref:Restriction endonuclease n=1 Tax=Dyadobacter frigoris TaxID=2576211 RepID=A0A4U6DAC9_9BACT|nr:restriction endonuclease [Dyadobacter frigoris]TKT93351.1 restriction endonuclease [Dyadobacter frigoris]GLU54663.1 hypothetical protein Dfri01_41240 [Dyadobacter frigoris]